MPGGDAALDAWLRAWLMSGPALRPQPPLTAALPVPSPVRAAPLAMLKLKDFPPEADFRAVMARHHDDFLSMLTR